MILGTRILISIWYLAKTTNDWGLFDSRCSMNMLKFLILDPSLWLNRPVGQRSVAWQPFSINLTYQSIVNTVYLYIYIFTFHRCLTCMYTTLQRHHIFVGIDTSFPWQFEVIFGCWRSSLCHDSHWLVAACEAEKRRFFFPIGKSWEIIMWRKRGGYSHWLCRQKDIAVQVLHNASVLGSTSGLRSSCWKQQIWCHWLDLLELWRNLPYLQKPFFPCVFFFPTTKYGFPVKFPEKQSNKTYKTAKQQVGHGMALTNSFSTRG